MALSDLKAKQCLRIIDKNVALVYNIGVQIKGEIYSGKIAAMVSGGMDSMVMLDLLIASGADVFVVHVNHGIRKEAESDSAFVGDYCAKRNIPFAMYSFDIPAMAKESGCSIETEARLVRRQVAQQLIDNGKADKVAVAHHADDNAETVLMHLLRGSGIDGLKGIQESDKLIRPLLAYTREQISDYAAAHDIPYVEDKTNYLTDYTRNFVRLEVLPLIKTRYPGAVRALNRLAQNATNTLDALDAMLDMSLISQKGDEVKLSLEAFDSPLATRYVILAAKKLMPVDITHAQIQNVLKLKSSKSGSKAELAGNLKAYKDYDCITFCFDKTPQDICVPFSMGTTQVCDTLITVSEVQPCPIKGQTVVSSLPDGCVFRRRKEGDTFIPYGGKSKSLKKYLIDKKVPKRLRDELICLCHGSEVLVIVGLEISDKCKITDKSKTAYLISREEKI